MKPPIVKSGMVKIVREGIGMAPIPQRHRAAPTKRGTWVWFDGFREPGMTAVYNLKHSPKRGNVDLPFDHPDNYSRRLDEWWRKNKSSLKVGWLKLDDMVYVGWTKDGEITRSGFFNSGDWNHLSVQDALAGLSKIVARSLAYKATKGYHIIDNGDIQIYVPKTTKIYGQK